MLWYCGLTQPCYVIPSLWLLVGIWISVHVPHSLLSYLSLLCARQLQRLIQWTAKRRLHNLSAAIPYSYLIKERTQAWGLQWQGRGIDYLGTHILLKRHFWMHRSLFSIKASAKCIHVNEKRNDLTWRHISVCAVVHLLGVFEVFEFTVKWDIKHTVFRFHYDVMPLFEHVTERTRIKW